MFLEVLTRHHVGRPSLLARNQASLDRQTDDDWQQTILIDDTGRGVEWANHGLARYAPEVEGEFVWVLDDDDVSVCDTLVADLKAVYDSHFPDVIMLRMDHETRILPENNRWGKPPVLGKIAMSCFAVKREIFQKHAGSFKAPRGADYQFIRDVLAADVYRIFWHDCIASKSDIQRFGRVETVEDKPIIGVIYPVWQRPERLAYSLRQLTMQTDQRFHLYLINNNPALADLVDEQASGYAGAVTVIQNKTNRKSWARVEVMHQYADEHPWFLTLDDDVDFLPTWMADWRQERVEGTLQGWTGFRFVGDYWHREQVQPGEKCHYLWGSNLAVSSVVVRDERVLDTTKTVKECDDLWLCYFANHVLGMPLQAATSKVEIAVDGKDNYSNIAAVKVTALEYLRKKGWAV